MPGLQKCPGCLKRFLSQKAHLLQTSNPLCQRLAKKRRTTHSRTIHVFRRFQPSPSSKTQLPLMSPRTDAIEDAEDSDSDSSINEGISSLESPILSSSDIDSESDPQSDMEPDQPPPPLPEDVHHRTWVTPKIVKFPNPRVGQPIGQTSSSYSTYAATLGNNSSSSPYYLFASKIDWEVAQWAKLRGPSSTSFADLLKIDGVCFYSTVICETLMRHISFMKDSACHTQPLVN